MNEQSRIEPWKFVAIGLMAGLLAGGFGIGGGLILVPSLVYVGLERHRAHATSLAAIILIGLTGAISLSSAGEVQWDIGLTIGIGGVIGSSIGATTMHRMSPRTLTIVFGFVLLGAGLRMIAGGDPLPGSSELALLVEILVALGIGLVAGFFAGIAGVGGGVINVPSMVFFLGLPQLQAQGTSFVAVVMTATAGTLVNIRNGRVVLREAALVGLGGSAGALTSSQISLGVNEDTLGRYFGVLVLVVSFRTLYRVFRSDRQSD